MIVISVPVTTGEIWHVWREFPRLANNVDFIAAHILPAEPPPEGHPMVDPQLLALPNFLLTPHVAWSSRPAMQALADQLIDNINAFAAGRRQHRLV